MPDGVDSSELAKAIDAAQTRLTGAVIYTPLLESKPLNDIVGARILVKAENLQRTGSFKFRGAYNRIAQLTPAEKKGGVIAYSSGNHAAGVACAAEISGVSATIIVPSQVPQVKIDNIRAYGATLEHYQGYYKDRAAYTAKIAVEHGAVLVPPYDNIDIIAGQATAGVELVTQLQNADISPDHLFVPCGGGGLLAGVSAAFSLSFKDAKIVGVEPVGYDDFYRSFEIGKRCGVNMPGPTSICDALLTPKPGKLTFAITQQTCTGFETVTDKETALAMYLAFRHLKIVLEPSGATALAAALRRTNRSGGTIAVIASGGNVDPARYVGMLQD